MRPEGAGRPGLVRRRGVPAARLAHRRALARRRVAEARVPVSHDDEGRAAIGDATPMRPPWPIPRRGPAREAVLVSPTRGADLAASPLHAGDAGGGETGLAEVRDATLGEGDGTGRRPLRGEGAEGSSRAPASPDVARHGLAVVVKREPRTLETDVVKEDVWCCVPSVGEGRAVELPEVPPVRDTASQSPLDIRVQFISLAWP